MKKHYGFIVLSGLLLTACGGEPDTEQPTPVDPDENYTQVKPFVRDGECAADIVVTPTRLRRFTHQEYDNAVRDLIGSDLTLAKAFPGDLPAAGFASNRGDPLAVLGAEKIMLAAEEHAEDAMARLNTLLPCNSNRRNRNCAIQFIETIGQRAYRRDLTSTEADALASLFDWGNAQENFEYGIQAVLEHVLQSPHFLYHIEKTQGEGATAKLSGTAIAGRLAAMIWQSIPDAALLQAAQSGALDTPEGIVAEAKRMMADEKGRDGVVEFFNQWLDIEKLEITEKDLRLYPEFTPELRAAMWEETSTFVDYVIRQGDGQIDTLFTSNLALPTGPLADFYGERESDNLVAIDATVRTGLLTHPSFLAVHAHGDQTSPVKRGAFVRNRVMCSPIPEAPANVDTTPPEIDPDATTRDRFSQHRENPACAGCHDILDPLGFAFEHFDAMGHYRAMEGDLTIDASGEIKATQDMNGFFDGTEELNQIFVESEQVRDCMATQWLRYAVRVEETSANACSLQQVKRALAENGNIQDLIYAVVQSDAFRYKTSLASDTGAAQ